MRSSNDIKQEYKKAVMEMAALENGRDLVAGEGDYRIYCELYVIKHVLEWVDPDLVTTDANGRSRIEQLAGDSPYYAAGPVDSVMLSRRA